MAKARAVRASKVNSAERSTLASQLYAGQLARRPQGTVDEERSHIAHAFKLADAFYAHDDVEPDGDAEDDS